jgi:hypothetical protein
MLVLAAEVARTIVIGTDVNKESLKIDEGGPPVEQFAVRTSWPREIMTRCQTQLRRTPCRCTGRRNTQLRDLSNPGASCFLENSGRETPGSPAILQPTLC